MYQCRCRPRPGAGVRLTFRNAPDRPHHSVPHLSDRSPVAALSRLLGTIVLVMTLAVGWWWWSGGKLPLPESLTTWIPFQPRQPDSMSTAPERALARAVWQPINAAAAKTAQTKLQQLASPSGPALVTLEPGQLASFLVEAFARQLPESARGAMVTVVDDMVYVKADVRLEDFGGESVLGPLAGKLDRRDTIVIGGTFDLIDERRAQFRIREVIMGQFSVPRPLVPKLVSLTRRGAVADSLISQDGYPVILPPSVADVRISRGRITVYRNETRTTDR